MSVSCVVCPSANMHFVRCYEEVGYKRALWELTRSYSGRNALEVSLSLVLLRFYFTYLS